MKYEKWIKILVILGTFCMIASLVLFIYSYIL